MQSGYGDDGLVHVAARYYDAQVGLFTTRDTYLDEKPYQYCDGDPVNFTDPSGHEGESGPPSIGPDGKIHGLTHVGRYLDNQVWSGPGPKPKDGKPNPYLKKLKIKKSKLEEVEGGMYFPR